MQRTNLKAGFISVVQVIAATVVYEYLIGGGWLTHRYQLNDPNIVNLALAIFEPIAIVSVVAYWIWRTPLLCRLLSIFFWIQVVIGVGFGAFILFFMLTWHPKMM